MPRIRVVYLRDLAADDGVERSGRDQVPRALGQERIDATLDDRRAMPKSERKHMCPHRHADSLLEMHLKTVVVVAIVLGEV